MKRRNVLLLVMLLIFGLLLSSCENPFGEEEDNKEDPITIDFESDGNGYLQYYTNDPTNYGDDPGYYYPDTVTTPIAEPMDPLTVELIKNSGSLYVAGSIIFCYVDNKNYAEFLLTPSGGYYILEVDNGTPRYPFGLVDSDPWLTSESINTGLKASNTIQIAWNTTDGDFDLSINGTIVNSFVLTSGNNNGASGFAAYVGTAEYENFPNNPVDFRFKMTQPIAIPSASTSSLSTSGFSGTRTVESGLTEYATESDL